MDKQYWHLFLSLLMALCVCGATSAIIPAGTTIPLFAECTYMDGGVMRTVRSNTVVLTIRQVHYVDCSADFPVQVVAKGRPAQFDTTVRNLGNGPDTFSLTASTTTPGWAAAVFTDADGDSEIDPGETGTSGATPVLAAGASVACSIVVYPTGPEAGAACSASFSAVSAGNGLASDAQTLTVSVSDSGAIERWGLLGYFQGTVSELSSSDYLATDGGEANAAPNAAPMFEHWRDHTSVGGEVDLGELYNATCPAVAYAGCYVYSEAAREATFWCDTADPLMVWVNGSPVHVSGNAPDGGRWAIPVELMSGYNRILLKSSSVDGDWRFAGGLADDSGAELQDVAVSSRPDAVDVAVAAGLDEQNITAEGAIVTWETSAPTSTVLEWRTAGGIERRYDDPALTTTHSVVISGLAPGTACDVSAGGADVFGTPIDTLQGSFVTLDRTVSKYINKWLINGPHYTSGSTPSIWWDALTGEDSITPYYGLVSRGRGWKYAYADETGVVDVLSYLPDFTWGLVYLHVYVYSPIDQEVRLLIGSDGSIRALLNGKTVQYANYSRYAPDAEVVPVRLLAGRNRLMVKVLQHQDFSRLSVRFTDAVGQPLKNIVVDANYSD